MFCCFRSQSEPDSLNGSIDFENQQDGAADIGQGSGEQQPVAAPITNSVQNAFEPVTFQKSEYQQLSRKLLDMLNDMRAAGAEFAVDLPVVVVCGNQSAGKSSVIESLCGVALPRSDSTCTRCPTEVRMLETAKGSKRAWSCTIKLRKEVDVSGHLLIRPIEKTFKEQIRNRSDVERYVRDAQQILLGTKGKPAPTAAETEAMKFTRNLLVLEIYGAPVNLTLVDLPGIIHNVEKPDDAHYKNMIQDLVREYISKETAIIVAAVSCKEDIETQGILSLAREVDPQGIRTVGVLTKPDQVEEACHGQWIDVLTGRKYPLRLGYYLVKNPNQKQLLDGITFEQARETERQFFKSTKPWRNLSQLSSRFGVDNLRSDLSKILVNLTNRVKPTMLTEVSQKLHLVKEHLEKLPSAVSDNPYSYLLGMVDNLGRQLHNDILAKGDDKAFYQRLLQLFNDFRTCVFKSKPRYAVGGEGTVVTCPLESGSPTEEKMEGVEAMTCEEVRGVVEQHRSVELPGFSPYSAVEGLIAKHLTKWQQFADSCLDRAMAELQVYVGAQVDDVFNRFPQAHQMVKTMAMTLLEELYCSTQQLVRGIIVMELNNTFTVSREEFEKTSADFLALLKAMHYGGAKADKMKPFAARLGSTPKNSPRAELVMPQEGDEVTVMIQASESLKSPSTKVHTPPWTFQSSDIGEDQILSMMAVSLTYFGVASHRVTDVIPMHIMHYLIGRFVAEFRNTLLSSLMVKDRSALGQLLTEDDVTVQQRNQLQGQSQLLEQVLKSLQAF